MTDAASLPFTVIFRRSAYISPGIQRSSCSANVIRTRFGGDCANPATVPGALHAEPARGSVDRDMMSRPTMLHMIPPAEALSLQSLITPTEQGIATRILAKPS